MHTLSFIDEKANETAVPIPLRLQSKDVVKVQRCECFFSLFVQGFVNIDLILLWTLQIHYKSSREVTIVQSFKDLQDKTHNKIFPWTCKCVNYFPWRIEYISHSSKAACCYLVYAFNNHKKFKLDSMTTYRENTTLSSRYTCDLEIISRSSELVWMGRA